MSNDTAGHPRIDFAWGNMPMQPNTERGIHPLDPVLDSHEIAYLGWNGFPDYVPNTTHTNSSGSGSGGSGSGGGVTLVAVPNFIGLTANQTSQLAQSVGVSVVSVTSGVGTLNNGEGATAQNNGLAGTQSTAPGTLVAPGTQIIVQFYIYVANGKLMPNIVGMTTSQALAALDAAGFGTNLAYYPQNQGATPQNDGLVSSQSYTAGEYYASLDYAVFNYYEFNGFTLDVANLNLSESQFNSSDYSGFALDLRATSLSGAFGNLYQYIASNGYTGLSVQGSNGLDLGINAATEFLNLAPIAITSASATSVGSGYRVYLGFDNPGAPYNTINGQAFVSGSLYIS